MDVKANYNMLKSQPYISARNRESFAAFTLQKRFPAIINNIIKDNDLSSNQLQQFDNLLNSILNGVIEPLRIADTSEAQYWKDFFKNYTGWSYFDAPFFMVEAYIYKRIDLVINYLETEIDPFSKSKMDNVIQNVFFVKELARKHSEEFNIFSTDYFSSLVYASLWGNSADLSQLSINNAATDINSRKRLLINDINVVHDFISIHDRVKTIEYIADNAGLELITDLFFIDFLLSACHVTTINLHLKRYPTFVSDATLNDLYEHLSLIKGWEITELNDFVKRIYSFIDEGRLRLHDHYFWNSPMHFTQLPIDLSKQFDASDLIFFKGDANFRRLFEDREWPPTIKPDKVLSYLSTPIVSIRTLKSEIMVGLDENEVQALQKEDIDWKVNGRWGLIMFI